MKHPVLQLRVVTGPNEVVSCPELHKNTSTQRCVSCRYWKGLQRSVVEGTFVRCGYQHRDEETMEAAYDRSSIIHFEQTAECDRIGIELRNTTSRHIVVPIDFSPASLAAAELASDVAAAQESATVTLLSVVTARDVAPVRKRLRLVEERIARQLGSAAVRLRSTIHTGNPVDELLRLAATGVDLVVMGIRGINSLGSGIGSVARLMIEQAACSVLCVRGDTQDSTEHPTLARGSVATLVVAAPVALALPRKRIKNDNREGTSFGGEERLWTELFKQRCRALI